MSRLAGIWYGWSIAFVIAGSSALGGPLPITMTTTTADAWQWIAIGLAFFIVAMGVDWATARGEW